MKSSTIVPMFLEDYYPIEMNFTRILEILNTGRRKFQLEIQKQPYVSSETFLILYLHLIFLTTIFKAIYLYLQIVFIA